MNLYGPIQFKLFEDADDVMVECRYWKSIDEVTKAYKEFVVTALNFDQAPAPYELFDADLDVIPDSEAPMHYLLTWGEDPDHGIWVECIQMFSYM